MSKPEKKPSKNVRIKGPVAKGKRVLRPAANPPRPKATRFYNPNGEDFEDICPLHWARQLVASGSVEIIGPANDEAPAAKPAASKAAVKPADKGDK